MGNRANRRAWMARVQSDPRLSDLDRQVALAVAEMDRRGFTLCQDHGEFFFQPKREWTASLAA